ncbi:hypothetical protein [Ferruginivarius sediminum]|uniref:hypothetical protein n=1 Tax=Ferruginivarius sediminum TaxID=2661937 RepID=UPI0011C07E93|nr:hypothetical protein [Ferruginivarius sediminum]
MQFDWRDAGVEPPLEDILSDPIVGLVARRDGLSTGDIRSAVFQARNALSQRRSKGMRVTPEELVKA